MDEQYHAKLTASPPDNHRTTTSVPPGGTPQNDASPHSQTIPAAQPPQVNGLQGKTPIPVHFPNIYVNPFSPQPAPPAPSAPDSVPTITHVAPRTVKIGPWRMAKPHPLLWLCLALSLLALVLEVPKGSLPTLTGRHKALRTREKQLQDRLNLLGQLSSFLPPPLASLVTPDPDPVASLGTMDEQFRLIPTMKFWNTYSDSALRGRDGEGEKRWWSVEDLGEGASVVRSRNEGEEKEVWVLRMGEQENDDKTLLRALTHSLLLRNRLLAENTILKSTPCPACPARTPINQITPSHFHETDDHPDDNRDSRKREWEQVEERKRREKERERQVEEREREVVRREKWVVEEMRKLSDTVHSQATELTLEDRITERLKAYQRQLEQVGEKEL